MDRSNEKATAGGNRAMAQNSFSKRNRTTSPRSTEADLRERLRDSVDAVGLTYSASVALFIAAERYALAVAERLNAERVQDVPHG